MITFLLFRLSSGPALADERVEASHGQVDKGKSVEDVVDAGLDSSGVVLKSAQEAGAGGSG